MFLVAGRGASQTSHVTYSTVVQSLYERSFAQRQQFKGKSEVMGENLSIYYFASFLSVR
jgi:hypothetical protein